jgi:hypothetical protein
VKEELKVSLCVFLAEFKAAKLSKSKRLRAATVAQAVFGEIFWPCLFLIPCSIRVKRKGETSDF